MITILAGLFGPDREFAQQRKRLTEHLWFLVWPLPENVPHEFCVDDSGVPHGKLVHSYFLFSTTYLGSHACWPLAGSSLPRPANNALLSACRYTTCLLPTMATDT